MTYRQRGASTLDVAIALSLALGMGGLVLPPLYRTFDDAVKAQALTEDVRQIKQASQLWYGNALMQSRCLTQTTPLHINTLISDGLVDNHIQTQDWQFAIATEHSSVDGRWQRPSRFIITATIPDDRLRDALHRQVNPSGASGTALVFEHPIAASMADTLALIDRETGCLQ